MKPTQREYSTKDISNITDIADSTVRKYAQHLEKSGYRFIRNEKGHRIYTERDIGTFNEFKNLSKKGVSVEDIADMMKERVGDPISDIDINEDNNQSEQGISVDMINELITKIDNLTDINKQQEQFNKELLNRLDQQQKYIERSLNNRDENLLSAIKEMQETKKLLASSTEKTKWWEVWKK